MLSSVFLPSASWFSPAEAPRKLLKGQFLLLDQVQRALGRYAAGGKAADGSMSDRVALRESYLLLIVPGLATASASCSTPPRRAMPARTLFSDAAPKLMRISWLGRWRAGSSA